MFIIVWTVEKQPMLLLELDLNTHRSRSFTEKMSIRRSSKTSCRTRSTAARHSCFRTRHHASRQLRPKTLLLPALQNTQSKILLHDSKRRATLEPDLHLRTLRTFHGTCIEPGKRRRPPHSLHEMRTGSTLHRKVVAPQKFCGINPGQHRPKNKKN